MIRLLVAAFVTALHTAQPAPEPTIAAAMARLQAKDADGAARILELVVKREPTNGRAWRNLGVAYQTAKDYDRAIAAYQHALEVEPSVPTPLYQLGLVYAIKRETDKAFEFLGGARATRKIDMTQATVDDELRHAYLGF